MKKSEMNVPRLRFPGFEGEWQEKQLNTFLDFKNGINASKEQYGRGVKFINVLDILNNDYLTSDRIIGSVDVAADIVEKNLVSYGDILFQRSSETREDVGTACVYLDSENTATFGGFVIRGRKIGVYDPVFFNKLLKTDLSRNEMKSKSGGSTRYNIGQDILSSIKLPFPSLSEQNKIASFLNTLDDRINNFQRKKSLLEQYKKGMMQKIFNQEVRFKDDDGKEFGEWEAKSLGEVAHFRRGSFPQPYGLEEWYDDVNGYPFVQVFDVDDNMLLKPGTKRKISSEAAKQSVLAKAGTLLLTIQGSIGRIAVAQYDTYVDRTLLIFKSYKIDINVYYFKYVVFLLFEIEKERAPGGTIKTITKEVLTDFTVPIPVIEEQTKIANFLSAIDDKIDVVAKQIEKMEEWKKGLLGEMFV